jgi:hypothetical protein
MRLIFSIFSIFQAEDIIADESFLREKAEKATWDLAKTLKILVLLFSRKLLTTCYLIYVGNVKGIYE